uniref:NAD-dependent protein deacetylase n=1 Tax=uncultured Nocardioidaceae bacterium TaxID=253824 RepID=A0A6J4L2B0_9ACTN|nr:MAG: NAD-dependent protein deacetylase of SIR2 family [uncultured Nocardioidaceae bacterium]
MLAGRRAVVLTGAGVSTDSGIPDYRGPGSPARTPMTYDVFRSGSQAQQRYWSRAFTGWQHMGGAEPNDGHRALVELERLGAVRGVITQNVDGLHTRAGSERVIDLHGRIDEVVCLDCADVTPRARLQQRLAALNPTYASADTSDVEIAPDGDALVGERGDFVVAACERCGGRLKPHVVFFGENVPKPRVARAIAEVDAAEALLVLGSSLTVMSGLRFVRQAAKAGTPVVIVNRGATRGDDLADVKLEAGCTQTLQALVAATRSALAQRA